MANVFINDKTLKAIGDAIRNKTNTEELMLPADMPAAINTLALPEADYNDGYSDGYEASQNEYWDTFWDFYQQNGERRNYIGAFCGALWDDTTFKPKYDLIMTGDLRYTFSNNRISDLKGYLEQEGLVLDTSGITYTINPFLWSMITRLPVIDFSSASSISFYYAYLLKSIDKLILKQDGSQSFNFQGVGSLEEIEIEGVIGKAIDLGACPLSRQSIESVVAALSDITSKLTVTFKKTAKEAAFTEDEWNALKATKSNWTFALA